MLSCRRVPIALIAALLLVPASAHAARPANDNFDAATPLALGATVHGSTLEATAQPAEPLPSAAPPLFVDVTDGTCDRPELATGCISSVWYTLRAGASGQYTVETCDASSDIDTVVAVWSGTFAAPTLKAVDSESCAGGSGRGGSRVSFQATAGTVYHVEVAGSSAERGFFYLRAYAGPPRSDVPEPDTAVKRTGSYAAALQGHGFHTVSGARQSASFAFTSDHPNAAFQCSLDGAPFGACTSPVSYDGLQGEHGFAVRAVVAGAVDPTPVDLRFTVDRTPPDTSILAGPDLTEASGTATFRWLGTERSLDSWCGLDTDLFPGCGIGKAFVSLCNGVHTLRVAAVDPAGNRDPSPASRTFNETGGTVACQAPTVAAPQASPESPTSEFVRAQTDAHAADASYEIDWGRTASYGSHTRQQPPPSIIETAFHLAGLQPDTTYHYRVSVVNAFGRASTGDLTFTTEPLGATVVPGLELGAPQVVGSHAAKLRITANAPVEYRRLLLVSNAGPATLGSTAMELDRATQSTDESVGVVDLEPGTYHVRALLLETQQPFMSALTPDQTLVVPPEAGPFPQPTPPQPPHAKPFKLRRGFVKLLKVHRGSRALRLVVRHLPPRTQVAVTASASVRAAKLRRLGSAHARANRLGVARVKIKLSRKARRVLHNRHVRRLAVKVRVTPPGAAASSVTLRPRVVR